MTESAPETVQVPPHDVEAEAAVISAILLDPAAMPRIVDFLRPDHMFSEAHRRILEAAVEIFRAKDPVDAQTVASWLTARKRLAQVGGIQYITEILDASPVVANVRAHAVAVHDMWRRRQVIEACHRISGNGYVSVGDVQAWCEDAIRSIAKIGSQNPVRPVESNDEALARMVAEVCDVQAPEVEKALGVASTVTGFPTGIHGLDEILGGCHKGAKTTIAATTGAGKTTLAGQLAKRWSERGIGVLFFSTEVKRQSLLLRMVCADTGIPMERVKRKRLTPVERLAIAASAKRIGALPIKIDETARITIEEIAGIARTEAERMPLMQHVPLGAIFIDYAQRLEPSRQVAHMQDKKDRVEHSTKATKQLAQELDVAIVELAQAKPVERGKKREKPRAENGIADSSKIAHEADNVVFLVQETDDTPSDPRREVTAYVAKQRDGRLGEVRLMFRGDIYTFIDPNAPNVMANPSRQYVDPLPEPPPGRFPDDEPRSLTEGY